MANAINEKKNEWAEKGQDVVNAALTRVKNIDPEDIKRGATEIGAKVRDVSTEVFDDTVGYIRRNPVRTALGLCAIGFFAGLLAGVSRKSA